MVTALFPCPCCGHSITKQDAAGFRILGPDEVDQVTLERSAALADLEGDRHNAYGLEGPKFKLATSIATAIRALGRKA